MTRRMLILWLIIVLLIAGGCYRLRLDPAVLTLLLSKHPVVEGLKLYQSHFSNARELFLTLESRDPDAAESAARELSEQFAGRTNLVDRALWQPPWMENPVASAEWIAFLWLNQSPDSVLELVKRLQ